MRRFIPITLCPAFSPQLPFFFNNFIRYLAHKAVADMLINHGARPEGMGDMFVITMVMAVLAMLVAVSV